MALPLGHDTRKFCDTPAYATLRTDQYLMRQPQRDARASEHKLTMTDGASALTREAMQAARIRAARALQVEADWCVAGGPTD